MGKNKKRSKLLKMEISPFEGIKILSCYKEIKQLLQGEIPTPRTVDLFISNRCNHQCIDCHSKVLHNSKSFLELKKFKEIIDELNELELGGIEISGGGEPLLYPYITEVINYINSKGINIGLITNGIMITKELVKILVKNLRFIRIGFDAENRWTYQKIHGQDDYLRLLDNIRLLIEERAKEKSKVTIGLKYLISKINYKEIVMATKKAKLLNADYIQFKRLCNSNYEIPDNELKTVGDLINKAKLMSTAEFRVFGSINRNSIQSKCYLTPLHPCINTSGDVYLCYFFQHRMDTHKIGNLYQNSFREIWASPAHHKAIENIKIEECNLYDCPFHSFIKIVNEAIINDKMHLNFI